MNYTEKYLLDKIELLREIAKVWVSTESNCLISAGKDILAILDGK
jgi:hypothetical protein